jgi:hypothetical protein
VTKLQRRATAVTDLKLTLIILVIIVFAAVVGAVLGQLFPGTGVLYVVPIGIGIGVSIRLFARHLARKREN